MKLLQKRPVAAAIMVLAILAGISLGRARRPHEGTLTGDFLYLVHNEGGVITQDTAEYIEAMNESLFVQTGAQIAVDVVRTTGKEDIADYAENAFSILGVGSRERNNGILLVLALENEYNGAPDGDYYIAWGSGFDYDEQNDLEDILYDTLEADFAAKRYDRGLRKTFDALVDYLEGLYYVTVSTVPPPVAAMGNYQTVSGGYASTGAAVDAVDVIVGIILLLIVLFLFWLLLDWMRYSRYRRRYYGPTVVGIPRPVYYPVFWGRPRPPRRPPPPRPPRPPRGPGGFGGGPGGFGGGSFGGGAGRSGPRPGGPRPGGPGPGSFGGGLGGFGGGFFGGGAGRSGFSGGRSGGFGGGSFGGGAGRGGRSGGGGGRRR